MVLGNWSRKDTLYGGEGYSVTSNGDLGEQLHQAISRLPEFSPVQPQLALEQPGQPSRRLAAPEHREVESQRGFVPPPLERHIGEGSFFVSGDGAICQMTDGQAVPVVYGGKTLTSVRPGM